jgi:hypothetical protein
MAEEFGILRFQSLALSNLGWIALQRTSAGVAHERFMAALRIFRQLADRMGIAEVLEGLAAVAVSRADGEHAARLLGAAEMLREKIGVPIPTENRPLMAKAVASLEQALAANTLSLCWTDGRRASLEKILDDLFV